MEVRQRAGFGGYETQANKAPLHLSSTRRGATLTGWPDAGAGMNPQARERAPFVTVPARHGLGRLRGRRGMGFILPADKRIPPGSGGMGRTCRTGATEVSRSTPRC